MHRPGGPSRHDKQKAGPWAWAWGPGDLGGRGSPLSWDQAGASAREGQAAPVSSREMAVAPTQVLGRAEGLGEG